MPQPAEGGQAHRRANEAELCEGGLWALGSLKSAKYLVFLFPNTIALGNVEAFTQQ